MSEAVDDSKMPLTARPVRPAVLLVLSQALLLLVAPDTELFAAPVGLGAVLVFAIEAFLLLLLVVETWRATRDWRVAVFVLVGAITLVAVVGLTLLTAELWVAALVLCLAVFAAMYGLDQYGRPQFESTLEE